jgi:hypothetical protein
MAGFPPVKDEEEMRELVDVTAEHCASHQPFKLPIEGQTAYIPSPSLITIVCNDEEVL